MIRGIMGKKIGMTQIFDTEGNITPVTVVEAGPCTVLGLKDSATKRGGHKVVLGYESAKETRLKKPVLGFFKKIGQTPLKHVKEFESATIKIIKSATSSRRTFLKPAISWMSPERPSVKVFKAVWSVGIGAAVRRRTVPCITVGLVPSVRVQILPVFIRDSICPATWVWTR